MKNHKKFSRKKHIVAINISDALVNERVEGTSIKDLSRQIGVSEFRLRKIVNGETELDYLRSTSNGKLWQISYEFDYVVEAKPVYKDAELLDTTHRFTSAYKCCKYLGISKDTYYKRYKMQPIGVPCKVNVKDLFDREWQLTFLKELNTDKESWRFVQNENNNNK